jgi:hypothetical protein
MGRTGLAALAIILSVAVAGCRQSPSNGPPTYHSATSLANGSVLIAGGPGGVSNALTALLVPQLYDPASGQFTTTGSMSATRYNHTATLLADGKVLIAGGDGSSGETLDSAELYDPATGRFSLTGSMITGRSQHTATLLADGKVLIAGGFGSSGDALAAAELYDPASGRFSLTGSMITGRS